MSSEQKRAFLAVVLSGLVLLLWNAYFAPPAPVVGPAPVENPQAPVADPVFSSPSPPAQVLESITLFNGEHRVSLDGALRVSEFFNPNEKFSFGETLGPDAKVLLGLKGPGGEEFFPRVRFTQVERGSFQGKDEQLGLAVLGQLDEMGRLNVRVLAEKSWRFFFLGEVFPKELESQKRRDLVVYSGQVERWPIGDNERAELQMRWFGIDFHYHFFGISLHQKAQALVGMTETGPLRVDFIHPSNQIEFSLFYTKKEYGHLQALGQNLQNAVDFGFFGLFAIWILNGLQAIYSFVPNYGWAIIILTFFIRILLFPLQYKSIKSMKKMQIIQPELAKIREKYKKDPQELQKRTMELFKRTGSNPLGGCLPLLLQMPVFFAFYQVLYNAVELVEAPFILWIRDLSSKDPYYVLPLLMGATFFLQTKMTPSPTTDPTQKKIMMIMPIVFTFIMKDLPSGLNLYFTVSTVLGIVQQVLVHRYVK